jgi:predicted nuclease of restriction endonuclease-like (RecB) superfamily
MSLVVSLALRRFCGISYSAYTIYIVKKYFYLAFLMESNLPVFDNLLTDVSQLIDAARQRLAVAVNAEMTMLYWRVGKRINDEVLHGKRAEHGQEVINVLARNLTKNYGKGWSSQQLRHFVRFTEAFPDEQIVCTLCIQLSWSHFRQIIFIDDPLKRSFYIEICKLEHWSVRQLHERIDSMLYERTAISKKPEETIRQDLQKLKDENRLSPDLVFRDPYLLTFLGLTDAWPEKDLESAILAEMQCFITEMGSDFAFMARQKRITIDNKDYKIDLLFYHRRLKCLVAIDLKIGEFEAGHKGQMELYLRYLEKYEMVEGEKTPVGLILCTGKNEEHVELMQLDKSNIRIAEYITLLPSRELLQEKLHKAIELAKNRMINH